MAATDSQTFLRELDKKLWTAADRLRSNLDAAAYKHAVLGLIDPVAADCIRHAKTPSGSSAAYEELIRAELEERDYSIEKNVFWVPALARWKTVQDSAKLPMGTEIAMKNGKTATYKNGCACWHLTRVKGKIDYCEEIEIYRV